MVENLKDVNINTNIEILTILFRILFLPLNLIIPMTILKNMLQKVLSLLSDNRFWMRSSSNCSDLDLMIT
jgi:hypothetical protein